MAGDRRRGFIGSHLCEALLARGDAVRVLDDLSTGRRENLPPDVDADRRRRGRSGRGARRAGRRRRLLPSRRHRLGGARRHRLAGHASCQPHRHDHRVRCGRVPTRIPVVYASSAAVYGDAATVPIAEATERRPLSAYGADKFGCELHARVASHVHGIPTVGLRFFNVYGPRQDPRSPYSGVISIFCERIRRGAPIDILRRRRADARLRLRRRCRRGAAGGDAARAGRRAGVQRVHRHRDIGAGPGAHDRRTRRHAARRAPQAATRRARSGTPPARPPCRARPWDCRNR